MTHPGVPAAFRLHAKLLLEPWCLTPAQVALLTPEQVEHLYLRPQGRVADILRRQAGADAADGGGSGAAFSFEGVTTFDEFRGRLLSRWPDKTEAEVRESWARFSGEGE